MFMQWYYMLYNVSNLTFNPLIHNNVNYFIFIMVARVGSVLGLLCLTWFACLIFMYLLSCWIYVFIYTVCFGWKVYSCQGQRVARTECISLKLLNLFVFCLDRSVCQNVQASLSTQLVKQMTQRFRNFVNQALTLLW